MAPRLWLGAGLAAVALVAAGCGSASTGTSPKEAAPAGKPANVDRVIFIGDSITGGWGYESDNYPITGNLLALNSCAQDPPPMNECTNDQPGAANSGHQVGVKPWVSYPFQFAKMIAGDKAPTVENYAVSGATPAMWNPKVENTITATYAKKRYDNVSFACNTEPQDMATIDISAEKWRTCDPNLFPGLYGKGNNSAARWNLSKMPTDGKTMTVFTLGANPLMSRYLGLVLWGSEKTMGADTAVAAKAAASGDTKPFEESVRRNIEGFRVVEHLTSLVDYLADRGPVMMQKIYNACPGLFGRTESHTTLNTNGYAWCKSKEMQKLATYATSKINEAIDQAVANVKQAKPNAHVAAICPGNVNNPAGGCGGPGTFDDHPQFQSTQKFGGSFPANNPWLLSTDSGIHPNGAGHRFLANGVVWGACQNFGVFCDKVDLQTGAAIGKDQWFDVYDKSCRGSYYCSFAAIRNDTPHTWNVKLLDQDKAWPDETDAGQWVLLPPNQVRPGETMRFSILSRHSGINSGAKGGVTYTIGNTGKTVKIDTRVGVFSNSWTLEAGSGFKAEIDGSRSKKKGSEETMNGVVRVG